MIQASSSKIPGKSYQHNNKETLVHISEGNNITYVLVITHWGLATFV